MSIFREIRERIAHFLVGKDLDRLVEQRADEMAKEMANEDAYWLTAYDLAVNNAVDLADRRQIVERLKEGRFAESETFSSLAAEDRGWTTAGQHGGEIDIDRLKILMNQSRYLYFRNPIARNIIRVYVYLVVGSGVQIHYRHKNKQKLWDDWAAANDWGLKSLGIVRNTFIYGMWPSVMFPLSSATTANPSSLLQPGSMKRSPKDRTVLVRGFDPREITDLETDPHDVEKINFVHRELSFEGKEATIKYASDDLILFRYGTVGVSKYGRILLEAALQPIQWFHAYLQDRVILNGMRTRMPVIRRLEKGGRTRIQTEGQRVSNLPRAASILTVGPGEEWEYPKLNIDGGSSEADARQLLLYIAAAASLPEFLVSMNAETANRSSLQEAVDQLRPLIDEIRAGFGDGFEDLSERVVGERGKADWPAGERRASLDQVRAYVMAVDNRLMSRTTAASRLGEDWRLEMEAQKDEKVQLEASGLAIDEERRDPDQRAPASDVDVGKAKAKKPKNSDTAADDTTAEKDE